MKLNIDAWVKSALLVFILQFSFFSQIDGQCPVTADITSNTKCIIVSWGPTTPSVPVGFSTFVLQFGGINYLYFAGNGTTGSPAVYKESGQACQANSSPFNGTITIGSETCEYSAGALLPITLEKFIGINEDEKTILHWVTSSEINNEGFFIEKSNDGITWKEIGWVEGNGNSLDRNEYSFTDYSPYPGDNYYRLHQLDFDGQSTFSPVRNIYVEIEKNIVTIFPNPASNELNFKIDSNREISHVTVYNQFGQVMYYVEHLENKLDISSLTGGIYIIDIYLDNGGRHLKRFEVQ